MPRYPVIATSLLSRLPQAARDLPREATAAASLSSSIVNIVVPSCWHNEEGKYQEIGRKYWKRLSEIDKQQSKYLQKCEESKKEPSGDIGLLEPVGSLPGNTTLFGEQDVIKAAYKVLVSPIEVAVQYTFNNLVIRTRTEKSEDGSRIDMVWEFHHPGTDERKAANWTECAILEFKKPNVIKFEHFRDGEIGKRNKNGKPSTLEEVKSLLKEKKVDTLLNRNAIPLSKQARKYARRTPFVAMFDWDTMAIFDFTGTKVMSNEPVTPRLSFLSEHEVTDVEEREKNGRTYRMYLYGFVANAVEKRAIAAGLLK